MPAGAHDGRHTERHQQAAFTRCTLGTTMRMCLYACLCICVLFTTWACLACDLCFDCLLLLSSVLLTAVGLENRLQQVLLCECEEYEKDDDE